MEDEEMQQEKAAKEAKYWGKENHPKRISREYQENKENKASYDVWIKGFRLKERNLSCHQLLLSWSERMQLQCVAQSLSFSAEAITIVIMIIILVLPNKKGMKESQGRHKYKVYSDSKCVMQGNERTNSHYDHLARVVIFLPSLSTSLTRSSS